MRWATLALCVSQHKSKRMQMAQRHGQKCPKGTFGRRRAVPALSVCLSACLPASLSACLPASLP